MITVPFKAITLALLLLLPGAAQVQAADDKVKEKEIVIEDDGVATCDEDGPLSFHLGRHSRHGYIGVSLIEITPELREHYGTPKDAGVLVAQVESDSPAAKAGIQVGDIITAADGERIESVQELVRAVRHKKAGETVKMDLSRDRAAKHVNITVGERKGSEMDLGDLPHRIRERVRILPEGGWSGEGLLGHSAELGRLQEKVEALEKRLKEIEKRLPAR